MFPTKVVEKIKTHILCSITFCDNRAFYEVMLKNMLEPDKKHKNMAHAHCTLDNSGYKLTLRILIIITFPLQQWLRERASVLRYAYVAYLVCIGS